MKDIFLAPLLLGLSAGMYCFVYCVPFIAPIVVSEARGKKDTFWVVLKFIFGRLLGYLVFGAVFGYLGEKIEAPVLDFILNLALILLSLCLISHVLGLTRWKNLSSLCRGFKKYDSKIPLLMGVLMGVNVCPPFLMSLTYVFSLHSALRGMVYFFIFFIGTTIYFLPLLFLGCLSKQKEFQTVGRASALIVGVLFLIYSLYNITKALF